MTAGFDSGAPHVGCRDISRDARTPSDLFGKLLEIFVSFANG